MVLKDMYFTITEAAKELGVSRQSVYRWIRENKIPTEKIGGIVLIEKVKISEYATARVMEALFSMFDNLAFDSLREELGFTDNDVIERLDNEGDYLVFLVTHENGVQEKVLVGDAELTMRSGLKKPASSMKMKLKDLTRQNYKQPKNRSKKQED